MFILCEDCRCLNHMVSVLREWRGGRRKEGREDGGKGGWRRGREEGGEEGGGRRGREDGGEGGRMEEREGGWRRRGRKEEGQEDKGGEDGGEAGGYRLNHQCFECQAWGAGPQQEAQEIRKVGSLLPKWLGGNLIKVRETKKIERRRLR